MQVIADLDPWALEGELLGRIATAKAASPLAPVLVIVPTSRLADHVRKRLVERFGAIVGVEIVTHRGLARRALRRAGGAVPRPLARELSEALLSRAVRAAPRGGLRDFLLDRPAALSSLAATLRDLRDAGIDPPSARRALDGGAIDLLAIYEAWTAALARLERRGIADDAAAARLAVPVVRDLARRVPLVLHHGAYDLIGVHADLVRELDGGQEIVVLLPDRAAGAFGSETPGASVTSEHLAPLLAGKTVRFAHAQGARAELELAGREALAAVAAGHPPQDVAILVRSFAPYASAIEALFADARPAWSTSFTSPLRRDPRLAALLQELRADAAAPARRWTRHADAIGERCATAFGEVIAPAARRVAEILAAMRSIESLLDDDRAVDHAEAVLWLESAVDGASLPLADGGCGPRLLDLMQARGLTFRTVALAGLNAGVFPRVGREDPFLPDDARRRLRAATGRPVPVPTETDGEERLLLALGLASAKDALHVSWRRADETGRPVVPSLALRDLGRLAAAAPGIDELARDARALPAHPRARLESLAARPGLLTIDEEALLVALSEVPGPDAASALIARRPQLAAGCALVEATESFRPVPTPFDARVGRRPRRSIGVSALDTLGRCPLQFFFKQILRVPEPEEMPGPFEAPAAALGRRAHAALRIVYATLRDEGAFAAGDPTATRARAVELLGRAWGRAAGPDDATRAAALPLLDRIDTSLRVDTLAAFVGADLERLRAAALVPVAFEQECLGTLDLPSGRRVVVEARFDRVAEGAGRRVIGDYKTGGSLERRVDEGEMVSGKEMQVPLYAVLSDAEVELLGVGARHRTGDAEGRFATFPGFSSQALRDGFLETVDVLLRLDDEGAFPLHPDRHCAWCAYRPACRRTHPPTLAREDGAGDSASARAAWSKTAARPLLADAAVDGT